MERSHFNAVDVWEKLGITEHLGGIKATEQLLASCRIKSDSRVLDIGCGTGYTACLIAQRYGAQVVAADISIRVLEHTRKRIMAHAAGEQVTLVQADIHALDFPAETFDVVIAESVLVFCDQPRAAAEVHRVLKRGGVFGDNEFTFLKPPPPEWEKLLSSAYFGLDLQPLLGGEWQRLWEQAGFVDVSTAVSRLSLGEQFASHMRVDGWRKYLTAVARGLALPGVWAAFFNREMRRAWREYPRYVGYGLYRGVKA